MLWQIWRTVKSHTTALLFTLVTAEAAANPTIFWSSDPVSPGEVVVVAGHDLLRVRDVEVKSLTGDTSASATSAQALRADIVQTSNHALKFVLPPGLPEGMYRFRLGGDGFSLTGYLNTPTIYWTQGDEGSRATPGGWIRILGRNIQREAPALAELASGSGDLHLLRSSSGDRWEARFNVPPSLPEGHYRLRLRRGASGSLAWHDAGRIEVRHKAPPPKAQFHVTRFGATGDGKQDDTKAIQKALEAAAREGGGIIIIPRGYYKLSAPLNLPPNTVLRGAGKDATSLVWTDFESPPPILVNGITDFTVEDLTLVAARHFHFLRGGFPANKGDSFGANINITRVRIQGSSYLGRLSVDEMSRRLQAQLDFSRIGADTLGLAGRNIVVEDCEVYGARRSLFLLQPQHSRLSRNTFYNGRRGWYSITGADGLLFEHNRIIGADMQASGGGINTIDRSTTYSQNVLFRGNRMENMFGWDREAMTTDGAGGFYYGTASYAVTGASARLNLHDPQSRFAHDRRWGGAGVFIVGGRGRGQYRRVLHRDGQRVILDAPFNVAPDRTSRFSIVSLQRQYLILENTGIDTGATVQFYGTAVDHVFAGNRAVRSRGFGGTALYYNHFQPSWYVQFLENEITTPLPEKPSVLRLVGLKNKKSMDTLGYVLLLRRNRLLGNSTITIKSDKDMPAALGDILVENNEIRDSATGISVEGAVDDYLLRGNRFSNVKNEIVETR